MDWYLDGDDRLALLEERIAVGDPECRVVVYLTDPPPSVSPFTHPYGPPAAGDPPE